MKKVVAELIGTFAIVFCGTGAIVINAQSGGVVTHPGVAATFGLTVSAMIYALGGVSGAHFNPAVTLAFWAAKLFPRQQVVPYILSQVAGATLGSIALRLLFPADGLLGTTLPAGSEGQSFALELILTFLLMIVILQVATGSREQGLFAGLAIGSVVFLEALFAGPVCGASMNPARSLAPALVSTHTEHLWLYLLAPVTGAVLTVPLWRYFGSGTGQSKK